GTSHRVCGGPPEASTFLSLPAMKNPIERLSGDQNGNEASSVPFNGCAVRESSARTHNLGLPSAPAWEYTIRLPSGEIAIPLPKEGLSGAGSWKRTTGVSAGVSRK